MADSVAGPTAWDRIKRFLSPKPKTAEEEDADRRETLDAMHAALPDEVSAREAIQKDRERKRRMIDEAFRE